ncbi:MAG: hypothetical protein LPH19_07135 [Shewanella sp.]|nr:hypothetical protein [Shewanella sp.]
MMFRSVHSPHLVTTSTLVQEAAVSCGVSLFRKITKLISSLFILLGALFSFEAWAQVWIGADRLRLATYKWAPYQTHQNQNMNGFALNRVQCALGQMGQPYQLTMTQWSDAQLHVHSGQQHGFFVSPKTKEHDSYATLSAPITQGKLRWYVGPGVEPKLDDLSKLNLKFSAEFGSSTWFWLKSNGYHVVKQPRDAEVLLTLLKQREIDVALEDELVFYTEISQASLPSNYFYSRVFETKLMGVYLSNCFLDKYSDFLTVFNTALAKCEG